MKFFLLLSVISLCAYATLAEVYFEEKFSDGK